MRKLARDRIAAKPNNFPRLDRFITRRTDLIKMSAMPRYYS